MKSHYSILWPLYFSEFFRGFVFTTPIWVLFFQSRGLTLADIGLVATAVYLGSFIFEYPTGIFADKFGRKLSIICSIAINILAYLLEVIATSKIQFFIAGFIFGASWAFASGAFNALIYDSLKEKKLEKLNPKVLGIIDSIGFTGMLFASLTGAFIYVYHQTYPYWLTIIFHLIALCFILFIKEPKYKGKNEEIKIYTHFKSGLKLIWNKPVIFSLLILYFPIFLFEDSWYNASQNILTGIGLPIVFLGVFSSSVMIARIFGGMLLPKLINKISNRKLILSIILLESLVWIFLGSNLLYVVIASAILLALLHQFWNFVDADIIHDHIPSNIRATALSARQLIISALWIPIPAIMGFLINNFNRNYLFPTYSLFILIVGLAVFFLRKKYF